MTQSKYAFQAGLFILISILGAIALIARVAETRSAPEDATPYTAVFSSGQDVAGLTEGAEVRLLGVKVGRVESVRVAPPEDAEQDATIRVAFTVGQGLTFREDQPMIELQSALTGGSWLNILSVGTGKPLAEGGEIAAQSNNLMSVVVEVRDEMQLTLAAVRKRMDEVSEELSLTADSVESLAENADALLSKVDRKVDPLLEETTGVMTDIRGVFGDSGEDIRTLLAKFATLAAKLDTQLPDTLDAVDEFIQTAGTSIEDVDKLIAELTGTATEARTLISDNRADIERAVVSARRSVDEMEGLVDDLRANPSKLIWPPDEKDLKNQELYASARSYAEAAEDLASAAAALEQASEDERVDAARLEALRGKLMQQFEHFDKLQEEMWQRFER